MPEHETRAPRLLYDRETEYPHDDSRAGRRRRPVADWGGDDLFTRMPRRRSGQHGRRFAPSAAAPPTEDAQLVQPTLEPDAEPTAARSTERAGERDVERTAGRDTERTAGRDTERTAARDTERTAGRDTEWTAGLDTERTAGRGAGPTAERGARSRRFAPADLAAALEPDRLFAEDEEAAPAGALGELGGPGTDEPAPADPVEDDAPVARPTVVIGRSGRPEVPHPYAPYLSVSRRRPPRTVADRIGASPERLVAWAFALGLLLILIAVATADAAVRAV